MFRTRKSAWLNRNGSTLFGGLLSKRVAENVSAAEEFADITIRTISFRLIKVVKKLYPISNHYAHGVTVQKDRNESIGVQKDGLQNLSRS